MKRIALSLAVLLLALLAAEGALSLLDLPRLAARLPGRGADRLPGPPAPPAAPQEAVLEAPSLDDAPGLYRRHPDPRVRYTFRPNATLELHHAPFRTDALGFRERPGPLPEERFDLLVLGDSVAFGFGLTDEQILAARLEALLAPLAGPDAPPLVARTLALPGWNHRQAVAALEAHWPAFTPRVVVYLPISNDLDTPSDVFGPGNLRPAPDPAAPDPWLVVSRGASAGVESQLAARSRRPELAELLASLGFTPASERDGPPGGPWVTTAGLTRESQRRFAENVASLLALRALLERHDARLLVHLNGESAYTLELASRLVAAGLGPSLSFGQKGTTPAMQLPGDPHPNATTVSVRAGWIADALVSRGWVPRAPGATWSAPEPPPEYAALRLDPPLGQPLFQAAAQLRTRTRRQLHAEILVPGAVGLRQIYGGLNPDGSAGPRLVAALRAAGRELHVIAAPLPGRADLFPQRVAVELDGAPLGRFEIPATGLAQARFPLPESVPTGAAVELRLTPARWGVVRHHGVEQLAAFVLHRLALE